MLRLPKLERNRSGWTVALLCGCLAAVTVESALGQTLERRDTVDERPRPGLDADGVRLGDFTLFPSVGLGLLHNDNVFADDDIEKDDSAFVLSPELALESRSARHRAQIGVNADVARYSDFDSEDYDDRRIWAIGAMELGRGELQGEARFSRLHEARTSPDDPGCMTTGGSIVCSGLTKFDRSRIGAAYTWRPSRLLLRGKLNYTELDFDDTPDLPTPINNDDRDRSRSELSLRAGYALSPDYVVYAETLFDSVDYDQKRDQDGYERSSTGAEARLGMMLDFTGRTMGEFYIGYLGRDYEDNRFDDVDGLSLGASVDWNFTGLTTFHLAADRTVTSTTVEGSSSIYESRLSLGVDHELRRYLVLNAEVGLGKDDFEDINRDDDLWELRLGGKYLMNRYLKILFGYQYQDRDTSPSDSGGRVYKINELFVRLVGEL
jgi:hypothetical protein